jgi:hypothetical protein
MQARFLLTRSLALFRCYPFRRRLRQITRDITRADNRVLNHGPLF